MKDPIRFALVGCGRIAQSHLEAMASIDDINLTAIVEPREGAGKATAEQNQCPWFHIHEEPQVLEAADAVLICTPPKFHHPIARYFLERGVHVLCEKPLTLSSEDARDLVDLAEAERRTLMMTSKFRYVADVIKAKAIIEAGILGDIILYENTFCGRVAMHDRWNSDPELAGGGVLIDNGSHSVDIARYLLGPVQDVQAAFGRSAQGLDVEDTVRLQFRTESGASGCVDLSWSINKESDHYISVFGSEGTLLVGWRESRYRQEGNPNWINFGGGYDKVAAFRSQLVNFVATIRGEAMPLITAADGLASVEVIEAAYRSARQNSWLAVGAVS